MGAKIKDFFSRDEKNRGGEIMRRAECAGRGVGQERDVLYPLRRSHQGAVQRAHAGASGPRRRIDQEAIWLVPPDFLASLKKIRRAF